MASSATKISKSREQVKSKSDGVSRKKHRSSESSRYQSTLEENSKSDSEPRTSSSNGFSPLNDPPFNSTFQFNSHPSPSQPHPSLNPHVLPHHAFPSLVNPLAVPSLPSAPALPPSIALPSPHTLSSMLQFNPQMITGFPPAFQHPANFSPHSAMFPNHFHNPNPFSNAPPSPHSGTLNAGLGSSVVLPAGSPSRPSAVSADVQQKVEQLMSEANMLRSRNKVQDAICLFDEILVLDPTNTEALNCKGVCYKQLGNTSAAMAAYRHALEIDPHNWCALNNQGVIYKENGLSSEAMEAYNLAIQYGPPDCIAKANMATLLTDLGTQLKISGNYDRALARYQEAITHNPKYAPAYFSWGVLFSEMNRYDEALRYYHLALEHNPQYVEALCNIGVIYKNNGQLPLAIQFYEKALKINPNFEIANNNMAMAYTDLGTKVKNEGNIREGILHYKKALLYNTKYPDAWYNLGVAYSELSEIDDAIISYQIAIQLNPKCAEAYNNLGVIYKDKGNLEKSIVYYQAALAANPMFAQTLNNLGVIYTILGKLDEAYLYCQKAIEANPAYAEAYNNLGVLYRDEGRINEAIQHYEQCLKLDPFSRNAGQNRLLALNYSLAFSTQSVTQAHVEWGQQFSKQFDQYASWSNEVNPNRVLRIGYVSPDFFVHSVSYFIEAALAHCDRERFHITCYSNVVREDHKTLHLKRFANSWRQITGLTSKQAAELIRQDKIDILVELTGHTAGNRLDILAHKPAPIQVTWIGYPNTTGLPTIDYRISDGRADPEDTKQTFVEELVRLPECFLCYTPPSQAPEPSHAPAASSRFVTFGSFNNLAKINSRVLDLWCEILNRVPNSRLLIKSKPFASDTVRLKTLKAFENRGVPARRVDLLPLILSPSDHLRAYSLIDISLDTFPYAGTTTTCEALFMGVPVVTLKGDNHAHNVGVSLLSSIKNADWLIASDEKEYVRIAVDLANNLERLTTVRSTMRQAMLESPLCDATGFSRHLEEAYTTMWRKWCRSQS